MRARVRIQVDAARCEGTGFCARVAPHLFVVAPAGTSQVLVEYAPETELEVLQEAEELCPTRAIRIELDQG